MTTTQTRPPVSTGDILCRAGNANGHDHYCTDCFDGVLPCDCGKRAAVTRVDDGSRAGLLQCQPCLDESAALEARWAAEEAAETQRRAALWSELERAALAAGEVARTELAGGAA